MMIDGGCFSVTISEEGLRIGSCGKGTADQKAGGRRPEARRSVGEAQEKESEGRKVEAPDRAGQQWMGMGTGASEAKRWDSRRPCFGRKRDFLLKRGPSRCR
jgi:hypothetical protein